MANITKRVWRIRCLADQRSAVEKVARDIAYGVEAGDDMVPVRLKLWLDDVFHLARTMADLAASTVKAKTQELKKRLNDIPGHSGQPACQSPKLRGCSQTHCKNCTRRPEDADLSGLSRAS